MFTDDALCQVLVDLEFCLPTMDVEVILNERPDLIHQKSPMGYPLHEACMRGVPLDVIKQLITRFPSALTANVSDELEFYRQSPIFLACSRVEPDLETIAFLIDRDPTCLQGTNERPPLYHFCMGIWNQPLTVWTKLVDFVLSKYPKAAHLLDAQGKHAIHYAISTSDTARFRNLLQSLPPESLLDADGNHVLHLAVANTHCVPQNLQCLLEECPEAVFLTNSNGELPVHLSTKKHDRFQLLELHPYGLMQTTADGRTVLGNIRGSLNRCIQVYYPEVGEVIDGESESDDDGSDEGPVDDEFVIRREEHDWQFPVVSWVFPTNPTFLLEWDDVMNILKEKVVPPLQKNLEQACSSATGAQLPTEVTRQILRFCLPHYDESICHSRHWPPLKER